MTIYLCFSFNKTDLILLVTQQAQPFPSLLLLNNINDMSIKQLKVDDLDGSRYSDQKGAEKINDKNLSNWSRYFFLLNIQAGIPSIELLPV